MRTCLRHSVLSASQARSRHERLVNAAAVAVTAVAHRIKSIIPTHKNYIILMCWKFILYGEPMIRIRICGSRNRHLVCPVCTQRSPCNVALTYRWEKERKNEMICAYHLYPFFFFISSCDLNCRQPYFFGVWVFMCCVCAKFVELIWCTRAMAWYCLYVKVRFMAMSVDFFRLNSHSKSTQLLC